MRRFFGAAIAASLLLFLVTSSALASYGEERRAQFDQLDQINEAHTTLVGTFVKDTLALDSAFRTHEVRIRIPVEGHIPTVESYDELIRTLQISGHALLDMDATHARYLLTVFYGELPEDQWATNAEKYAAASAALDSDAESLHTSITEAFAAPDTSFDSQKMLDMLSKLRDSVLAVLSNSSTTQISQENATQSHPQELGMWEVDYYIDEFGKSTKHAFVSNEDWITGTFSSTISEDRKLNVGLMIDDSESIAISLYKNGSDSPVKTTENTIYNVTMLKPSGEKVSMLAFHNLDRLIFSASDSQKMHNAFMEGGELSFYVVERDNSFNTYRFTIPDASYYENAYSLLTLPTSE